MADESLRELAAQIQEACERRCLTVAVAESCTGGLIADAITDTPGASAWFAGGVVAYSNASKVRLLDVPADVLEAHGAVSAQVAQAMARGACERFAAQVAVAVTGVAGPGGGTAAKPVGLTYVAVAGQLGSDVRRFSWTGDRQANKGASARAALEMLLESLGEAS
jgi:nicotinamide-nucleotide amidase